MIPYTGGNFGLFAALGQGQGRYRRYARRSSSTTSWPKGQRALRRGDLWARWTPSRGSLLEAANVRRLPQSAPKRAEMPSGSHAGSELLNRPQRPGSKAAARAPRRHSEPDRWTSLGDKRSRVQISAPRLESSRMRPRVGAYSGPKPSSFEESLEHGKDSTGGSLANSVSGISEAQRSKG